jgi:glycosyltransferase involved in cell wall biosynthesis
VIHNGLADPASSLPKCHPGGEHFRIGIVGQVGAWKGHDDLVEAFALVLKRFPQAELHIFGTGDAVYKSKLVQKCIELGLGDSVTWHDFVADRSDIYSNLDACVVPSRSEDPLPLAAIEPGFFDIPSIATRRGGLPEIIEHEVNGLLVEPNRPAEIAHALSRLIGDPFLRHSLAINARQIAIQRFGRDRFLREFLRVLADGEDEVSGPVSPERLDAAVGSA